MCTVATLFRALDVIELKNLQVIGHSWFSVQDQVWRSTDQNKYCRYSQGLTLKTPDRSKQTTKLLPKNPGHVHSRLLWRQSFTTGNYWLTELLKLTTQNHMSNRETQLGEVCVWPVAWPLICFRDQLITTVFEDRYLCCLSFWKNLEISVRVNAADSENFIQY